MAEISAASVRKETEIDSSSQVPADEIGDRISFAELVLPWESWHSYFVAGERIGHIHVRSEIDAEGGSDNVLTTVVDQLIMRRGPSTLKQTLIQTCIEARDGSLVSFNADLRVGPARTRFVGRTNTDSLAVETIRGTTRQSEKMPWSPQYRGLAAIQQTLLAMPIKLSETRHIKMLVPMYYRMATVELNCRNRASISTMDGVVHDALEVDVRMVIGAADSIESTIWVGEQGELLKSYTSSIDLISIRTTKEDAENAVANPTNDLLALTSIAVTGKLEKPLETYRAGYVLKPRSVEGKEKVGISIEPQIGQWFRKLDDGSIQVVVSRNPTEAGREGFTGLVSKPEVKDSESGPIIDSAAPNVKQLASLSKAKETKDVAIDLTRTVKQLIGPGDFTRGFATASQTARDGVGDCTERAVLLAAMLRSRNIPARVAAGLVYTETKETPSMAYHMWTLAWIDTHWVALDPTSGTLAPADRIAFATSDLADGNEFTFVTPILSAMGRMEIQIVTSKYQVLE